MNLQAALVAQKRAPLYDAHAARAARAAGVGKPVGLGKRVTTGLGSLLGPSFVPLATSTPLVVGTAYTISVLAAEVDAVQGVSGDTNPVHAQNVINGIITGGIPDGTAPPVLKGAYWSLTMTPTQASSVGGPGAQFAGLVTTYAVDGVTHGGLKGFWTGLSTMKKVAVVGGGVAVVGGGSYFLFFR